jgi:hypothetical protein
VIRGFILGFVMLNGIVFPFLLPLFRLLGLDRYAEKTAGEMTKVYSTYENDRNLSMIETSTLEDRS